MAAGGRFLRGVWCADPQLVAGLVKAEGPGLVVKAGVAPGRGGVGQRGGEGVEHVVGQLVEGFPDHRHSIANALRATSRVQLALQE